MTDKKIHFNDFHEATQDELRQTYKIGHGKEANRQLEVAIRQHLDGANAKERQDFYQQFYGRRK